MVSESYSPFILNDTEQQFDSKLRLSSLQVPSPTVAKSVLNAIDTNLVILLAETKL
jgi:hypothetical protein